MYTGTETDRNRVLKSLEKLEKQYIDCSYSGEIPNIFREEEARTETRTELDMFSTGCPLGKPPQGSGPELAGCVKLLDFRP